METLTYLLYVVWVFLLPLAYALLLLPIMWYRGTVASLSDQHDALWLLGIDARAKGLSRVLRANLPIICAIVDYWLYGWRDALVPLFTAAVCWSAIIITLRRLSRAAT